MHSNLSLTKHYEKLSSYQKAIELYTKAAEKGCNTAMNKLGDMYYYGHGVDKDYTKAIELYYKGDELTKYVNMLLVLAKDDDLTSNCYEILSKIDLNKINDIDEDKLNILKIIKRLYRSKIDLLELHFKYQPNASGYTEAKEDFMKSIDSLEHIK